MRYKLNPERPYNISRSTPHSHHEIWDGYQPMLEKHGDQGAPDWSLQSSDLKYGKGVNKGNTKFFDYCVKNEHLIKVDSI